MVFSLEHDIKVTKNHQNLLPTQSVLVAHTVLNGCSFKFILKVSVEESHHRLQITDELFKSNLTFCVVCGFTLQTDETLR
jgi:hypothetical protein